MLRRELNASWKFRQWHFPWILVQASSKRLCGESEYAARSRVCFSLPVATGVILVQTWQASVEHTNDDAEESSIVRREILINHDCKITCIIGVLTSLSLQVGKRSFN
jgi:hypothetical protein